VAIATWPVVGRDRVVHAYKPGESTSAEGPFRTLRGHAWATAGVRVARRSGGRLRGQLIAFSVLNVEAARLARHGYHQAAARVAQAAAKLEAAVEFRRLQELLAELPDEVVDGVIDGVLPSDPPAALVDALRSIARRTERLRGAEAALARVTDVVAGRIVEVHEGYVVLAHPSGPVTMVPRWMAAAAHRDEVGDLLVLVTDRLDSASAVIEAAPAIAYEDLEEPTFTPFGRGDPRVTQLTRADELLLSGTPEPLTVLVPVLIEG
jgi:hypothetical protein